MVRRGPKADHTLHKTDPSLCLPSPVPEADTRPRPTQGPVCPGLSYPAPSSPPPMPSTAAEGHHVLTGGASWGLGIGLGTRWGGPSRQCGTGLGTTLRLTRETIPILSPSLSSFSPADSFPSFPRTSLPALPASQPPQTLPRPALCPSLPRPPGSQGASPHLLSSCLWLGQGGSSPRDLKGHP